MYIGVIYYKYIWLYIYIYILIDINLMSRWCCQERWAQDFVAQRMQLAHEAQECTVAEARPWKSVGASKWSRENMVFGTVYDLDFICLV